MLGTGKNFLKNNYNTSMKQLLIDGNRLKIKSVGEVARCKEITVGIHPRAQKLITEARSYVDDLVARGEVVYGLTTGFGKFQDKIIPVKKVKELQLNLIRSHSVGVGDPFAEPIVRAAMLIRANTLAKGYSGVRLEVIQKLLELLNNGIYPYVPEKGSLCASGDLAPLSHLALVLLGEGEVIYKQKREPAAKILQKAKIKPIILEAKEGLALNNGTSFTAAIGCLAYLDSLNLINHADIAAALSIEALLGKSDPFDPDVHKVRPYQGQITSAKLVKKLIQGSQLIDSVASKVQDSYSLRCVPQVHGAVREALHYVQKILETEINSVTDNPLIFSHKKKVVSAGNFHGAALAAALDFLAIALTDLASISERRIAKMVDPANNEGLPAFLVKPKRAGLDSGFMLMQYTAAALVAENRILSHPASVDSIPTSANQEDHVSMGMNAALKLQKIVKNLTNILSIEFLTAAQALDFRDAKAKKGRGTQAVYRKIREIVPTVKKDRIFYPDIQKIADLIRSKTLSQKLRV